MNNYVDSTSSCTLKIIHVLYIIRTHHAPAHANECKVTQWAQYYLVYGMGHGWRSLAHTTQPFAHSCVYSTKAHLFFAASHYSGREERKNEHIFPFFIFFLSFIFSRFLVMFFAVHSVYFIVFFSSRKGIFRCFSFVFRFWQFFIIISLPKPV